MSKTTRNIVVTVAVIVIVAVAAIPFVIKAMKNRGAEPVDTSISETVAATDEFTYQQEPSTDEILTDILSTMENIEPQEQQNVPSTTVPATQNSTTQNQGASTPESKPSSTTTTKKQEDTKKPSKQESTTASSGETTESNGPVTALAGVDAMANSAVVSYMYNPEADFFYVEDNPWQRQFGFNLIYDWGAAMVCMYYDTFRAQFDYDNTEWMIQAWKGQYGFLFIGGEIGVYTREPGSAGSHYNCADDNHLINMEMSIYYNDNKGGGYQLMFTRTYYPHWWSTGFVDGHLADFKFNDRSCIIMIARLTMYDETMTSAFAAALEGCGFTRVGSRDQVSTASSDTFTVVGNDIYYSWKNIDEGITTRG